MTGMDIKPDAQGKVRDLYDLGDKLLLVATDRISAFDYILEDEIPHKGAVLTQLSCFWFELLDGVVENHLISADGPTCLSSSALPDHLRGRFMLVKKADMFPAECIVRGYLSAAASRSTRSRARCAASSCPRACEPRSRPSPSSRCPRRPRSATMTRTSASSAWWRSSRGRCPQLRDLAPRCTPRRATMR
ncbi:MAG: phosphoribosylaminoimidazolesuccinocarboxamide synthase [Gordonibacter urolithinfaciens]